MEDHAHTSVIGLMTSQSPVLLVGLMGILKSGHGFVPIEPEYPLERIAYMLRDCRTEILVTEAKYLRKTLQLAEHQTLLKQIICLDRVEHKESFNGPFRIYDSEDFALPENALEAPAAIPDQLVYVIYTSGSTGMPKGVPITHRNLVPLLCWSEQYFNLDEQTRVLQNLSYCFDFGVFELLTTLLFGGTLYFFDRTGVGRSNGYADFINESAINTIHSTPTFFREIISAGGKLETLEVLHLGGEPLTPRAVADIFEVVGDNCVLYNGYGPTESSVNCSIFEVGNHASSKHAEFSSIPIGKVTANNSLYILDRNCQLVPIGVSGELHVGGIGLTQGYLNRPDLTAEKFIVHPYGNEPGARLYKTGDLARYLDDGSIEFLGRIDYQVKVRGYRIELGEIEAVLSQHPAIRDLVVVVREDERGVKRLVAYLVLNVGPEPTNSEFRQFIKQKLPEYMVPSAFVRLAALPLNSNGKIDLRALPSPGQGRPELDEDYVLPRTPVEEVIAGICAEVLGLDEVGVYDNLFDLGCHSLLATRIIAQLRGAFEVELPLVKLFESPTIAGLAENVSIASRLEQQLHLPPVEIVDRNGKIHLSFAQERVWFLHRLDPTDVSYNVPRAARLRGPVKVSCLKQVFTEIVRRHEVLRTTFHNVEGSPVQVVHPPHPLNFPLVDLRLLPEAEREAEVRWLILEQARQPFDLAQGPLLRLALYQLSDEDYVLCLIEHHLVHDGWSQGVLLGEFLTLYAAYSKGELSPLPDLPRQFADFAHWQRQWLQGEVLDSQLAYWKKQLTGASPVLTLPTDRPRPAVQSFQGAQEVFELSAHLSKALRVLSRREGVTLFMLLLAAFKTLLYRYSGQGDISIGTGVANRRVREAEGLLGMIINTVVLRTDMSDDPPFRDLLKRVREVCLSAYAHQDTPFDKIVETLNPERSLSYMPLFQVLFSFLDTPMPEMQLPDINMSIMNAHNSSSKFDLEIILIPHAEQRIGLPHNGSDEGIAIIWNYSTALFDAPTMKRMFKHYQQLLEGIVADPAQRLSQLALLAPDEQAQLLVNWNQTIRDYPRHLTVHQLFELQTARVPDRIALIYQDQHLTYRELNRRANQLAQHLRELGVGPETLVGILMERSIEMIVSLLAILKAGGAYLPLDAAYPVERLAFILEDTAAPLLLTQRLFAERVPPDFGGQLIYLDRDWPQIAKQTEDEPENLSDAEHLAYVIYTSGSTGQPKGVEVTHRGVVRLLFGIDYVRLNQERTLLQMAPVSFDASTFEIWGALLHGGQCVLYPERIPTATQIGEMVARHAVTTAWLTASLFNALIDEAPQMLQGIEQLLIGGEALSVAHVCRAQELLPATEIINGYGPTEGTTFTCCYSIPPLGHESLQSIPIGAPVSNTQVYILDQYFQPVPVGVSGELYIGGDGLARGYLNRPELSAERFIPHPFSSEAGARLYRTGDVVRYLPDGKIEFFGRTDEQVKVRGFRIELGEIEEVLRQHNSVREAIVLAREDVPGEKRLVGYVTATAGESISSRELRQYLGERLPEYMIPQALVELAEMPLTASGKVNRRALPAQEVTGEELRRDYVAPRTEMEEIVAGIWREVLRVKRIGIHDNFFELGGHSLLAMQIISRVREVFEVDLPLRRLFESPTVAGMFMAIVQARISLADDVEISQALAEMGQISEVELS